MHPTPQAHIYHIWNTSQIDFKHYYVEMPSSDLI